MNCECKQGRRLRLFAGLFAGVILLCVAVSFLTTRLIVGSGEWSRHDGEQGHPWLHRELGLTESEAAAINELEPDYRRKRAELQRDFEQRILALRDMIVSSQELTPEMREAIHDLHRVHGQLQELSITHYYEMMDVLPEEKQNRLKEIAVQALSVPE